MCAFAAYGVCGKDIWGLFLRLLHCSPKAKVKPLTHNLAALSSGSLLLWRFHSYYIKLHCKLLLLVLTKNILVPISLLLRRQMLADVEHCESTENLYLPKAHCSVPCFWHICQFSFTLSKSANTRPSVVLWRCCYHYPSVVLFLVSHSEIARPDLFEKDTRVRPAMCTLYNWCDAKCQCGLYRSICKWELGRRQTCRSNAH